MTPTTLAGACATDSLQPRTRALQAHYLAQSLPKTEHALTAVSSIVKSDNR